MKFAGTTSILCLLALAVVAQTPQQDIRITSNQQYVIVPSDPDFDLPAGFTIEAWVYLDPDLGLGNNWSEILVRSGSSYQFDFRLVTLTRRLEFRFHTNQGFQQAFSTTTVPDQTWTHVSATYDGAILSLLINGTCVGSVAHGGTMGTLPNDLRIGSGWRGHIDELRIWDHARSPGQISETMHEQLDNRPGLVAAYHFNTGFHDSTGGHDGLAYNGLTLSPSDSPAGDLRVLAPSVGPIGAALQFRLRGAPANAPYFFDNSFAGSTFGTPLFAPLVGEFPLEQPLLNLNYGPLAPGTFVGYLGLMDAAGEATPVFNVPPFAYLIGLDLHSAFLYLDNLSPMVLGGISPVTKTRMHDGSIPVITSILPNQGPLAGNWPVAIVGQNFLPNASVLIRGQPATQVQVLNSSLITCLTPPGLNNGSFNLEVENSDGSSVTVINGYTYVNTLVVNSLTPAAATAGQSVTISGSGMGLTASVTVAGTPATITSASGMQLVFTMPAGAPCHAVVTVSKPDGQSASLPMNSGPFITSATASYGPYTGGTLCKISGGFFSGQAQVTVDGAPAVVLSATPNFIEFLTPPGLPGPAIIVITNPDGCTTTTSFSYTL